MQPSVPPPCSSWPPLTSQTRVHMLAECRKQERGDKNLKIAAAILGLPAITSYYFGWLSKRQFVVQLTGGVAVLLFLSSFFCYRWAAQALAKFNEGKASEASVSPDLFFKTPLIKTSQKPHERDFKIYPILSTDIKALAPDPSVTRLRICSAGVTDAEIEHLAKIYPKLTVIDLSDCVQLTDKSLVSLVQQTPQLRSLTLTNCSKITSRGLNFLSHFADLRRLDLTGCTGVNWTRPPSLPNLQVLQVENCPCLESAAFLRWAALLPHLSVFHWDQKFQAEDLEHFCKTGPLVKKMHAGHSSNHFPELENPRYLIKLKTYLDQTPITLKAGPYALKSFRDLSTRVWNLKELEDLLNKAPDLTTLEVHVSKDLKEGDAALNLVAEKGTHLAKLTLHGKFSQGLFDKIMQKHKQIKKLSD